MAKKASGASKRSKETVSGESRETIEAQVQAFLANGGKIEQIPKGVSGQTNTSGPKHITLGKKPRA
ncbi:hypothetical protein PVT68_17960 [Microbulbifer bruguierae]|uniref:Transcriptional regulator SutA RNAP-binding domain-containing protein n=1 Tax=Microbulbifer bruguierae TaxID=3029061 RepID=A0ABY8NGI9_9GAMM|nr:hypothetical protein [Microbulbifer bruguierae]WGL16623.1 hypothetical protein PVT68_17960 [Microbulbifer bruguierae]